MIKKNHITKNIIIYILEYIDMGVVWAAFFSRGRAFFLNFSNLPGGKVC